MIGRLGTCVRKQPIIALYFESENELKLYKLEARSSIFQVESGCDLLAQESMSHRHLVACGSFYRISLPVPETII